MFCLLQVIGSYELHETRGMTNVLQVSTALLKSTDQFLNDV